MAVLATGNTFAVNDQVTAASLNTALNSSTFDTGAVDDSTTQLSGGAIIVKDSGITPAKLSSGAPSWASTAALTLSGTSPQITLTDTDTGTDGRVVAGSGVTGTVSIQADINDEASGTNIIFDIDGSEVARMNSNFDFVIGGTGANARLHSIETNAGDPSAKFENSGDGTELLIDHRAAIVDVRAGSSDALQLSTNATDDQGIRIDTAGKVGVQNTSPATALDVTGTITTDTELLVGRTLTTEGAEDDGVLLNKAGYIYSALGTTGTNMYFINNTDTTAVTVGTISTDGANTAYNTSSDYRLKENITDLKDGIERVKELKPKNFNFKQNPDKRVDGFLAHQAQRVVPQAVTGEKDEVDDGGKPVYQQIDTSHLVPVLTAALQEAVSRIEWLETKVSRLEGRICSE